jgi:threonine/homoserine/homoserine lactone efflux protein
VGSFLTGALAGYGIAIPVGPVAVLIVQVGMRCGFRCAASAAAGAATADFLFAALAVVAGASLTAVIDSIEEPFRYVSAAILVVMAISTYLSARKAAEPVDISIPARNEYAITYAKFLGLTVVNPPTILYFAAFILGMGITEDLSALEGALFIVGAALASLSWQLVLATVGGTAHRRLSSGFQRGAGIVGSLVVLGMAAAILAR